MRKLVLLSLVVLGLGLALFNFKGLANQGEFDSIVLDFREDIPAAEISEELEAIAGQYNIEPRLNSEFSTSDHVYTLRGDRQLLRALKKSGLKQETEFIEPNYIYQQFEVPNDPDYAKQWNLRSINLEQAWDDTKGSGITVAVIDTGITQVPD